MPPEETNGQPHPGGRLRAAARALKRETLALWFAARHPDTPWYARLLVAVVVAYAFSPIDLIPDFIPVIGYVDDLILVPLGIWLALRLVPAHVMAEGRARAEAAAGAARPVSWMGAAVIGAIWLASAVVCVLWAWEVVMGHAPLGGR